MPFEPFYHRNPNKPFAQYRPGQTLYVVVKGEGLTETEIDNAYQEYVQWIDVPLAGIGLNFIWKRDPFQAPAVLDGTLVRVTFKKTGHHGAQQTNLTTYDITHNAQHFEKDKKYGAHVCLHEFVHILGVPHELHNPLVHFCLKPNWEKILNWESVRDSKVNALRLEGKMEEADWLTWHASQGLKDFYYCLRWTLFSDDTDIAYQFDPFHAAGGSVDMFHLYMDQIQGTEDIYTDKGIMVDNDRLMTSSLKTFLKSRFTTQKVKTSLNDRKKWFLNAQGIYDPEIFLPDAYLRRMTYKNPFMEQLIDDNFACVEDMQWFKYETMHRYLNLSGTDPSTRAMCASQFPYSGCDPFRYDNFLNIWNKENKKFSICPVWANNLRSYCASTTTQLPITTQITNNNTITKLQSPNYNRAVVVLTIQADYTELVGSPEKKEKVVAAVKKDFATRLKISESQIEVLSITDGSVKITVLVKDVEPEKTEKLSDVTDISLPTADGTTKSFSTSYQVTESPITTPSIITTPSHTAKKTNWVLIIGLICVVLLIVLILIAYVLRKARRPYELII